MELRDIVGGSIPALNALERMGLVRINRDGNPVKYEAVVG